MKKLIAILFCAIGISGAHAQEFYANTKSGGQIRLSMAQCPGKSKNFSMAYVFGNDGRSVYGCWTLINDMVHVVWDDGDTRIYPARLFQEVPGTEPQPQRKGTHL